jgi:hypothetical protein
VLGNDAELDRIVRLGKVIATMAGLILSLPIGAALSGLVAGHGWAWLPVRYWLKMAARMHTDPGAPGHWYPARVRTAGPAGSPIVAWTCIALVAVAVLVVSLTAGRLLWRTGGHEETFQAALADHQTIRRLTRRGLRRRRKVIRPDLGGRRCDAAEDGLYLGEVIR